MLVSDVDLGLCVVLGMVWGYLNWFGIWYRCGDLCLSLVWDLDCI